MIEFEHLTKEYNGIMAVDDLCLEIPDGEIFGLLGPNGAGKSTAILMLIGLIEPTKGRCLIDGVEVAKNPIEVKHRIGYMPEDVGFYGTLTADQNLDFFARLHGMAKTDREERINELLTLVGLEDVKKKVGGYSKGMRQRLGIANALITDPAIVILDEPTANLDPQGVADYRRIIKDLAEQGKTVLVSSHILSEVSRVCTSIGILSQGRLVATGRWEDLARIPEGSTSGEIRINVRTREAMPEFSNPEIISVEYKDDRREACILSHSDIRDYISDTVQNAGTGIRELSLDRDSLEDFILSYYQEP